jgi:hypothetical protein
MAFHRGFDRRSFLIGALSAAPALLSPSLVMAKDFWETKDPSTWTDEEILSLTSKSPWARLAVAEYKGADDPVGTAIPGGLSGRGQSGPAPPNIHVRWESAQPMVDALKTRIPPDFDGHYVLGVLNLPIAGSRPAGRGGDTAPDDLLERAQNGATLEVKGKGTVESGIARRVRGGEILLGFAKDVLPLAATDREIVFGLTMERFSLKAKFDGKDMVYRGKLAV